jgi:MerR family transcriptional regulator, redox-sensitive transcriptional activator SoxR
MGVSQRKLPIGEVAAEAGMRASRIRYYEAQGLIPEPERESGKRRYTPEVLRRLALIDAAQHVGFTLDEIRDLLGSRDRPAHERLRQLAQLKLPEIDGLIERATAVRNFLEMCSTCDCESLDVCGLFDERFTQLRDLGGGRTVPRAAALGQAGLRPATSGRTNLAATTG